MNLDLAIQNQVMGRSAMDNAMHGVASDLGDGHYRLNAIWDSENIATSLLGSPLAAYTPHPVSAHVRPPIQPQSEAKPTASFSEEAGAGYSVSYDASSDSWTLNRLTPKTGVMGFFARLNGKNADKPTPLATKSGANSLHRFLTTIESMDLPDDLKASIAQICLNKTDNTGISEYVGGYTIQSDLEMAPFGQINRDNEVDLYASEYVRPKALTGYTPLRNEIGDAYGSRVLPQTHVPASNVPIHSHNMTTF